MALREACGSPHRARLCARRSQSQSQSHYDNKPQYDGGIQDYDDRSNDDAARYRLHECFSTTIRPTTCVTDTTTNHIL